MRRPYRHSFPVVAALFALPSAAVSAPINPNNPPQGRFSDEWAEIYMTGAKVGYAHTTMNRDGDLITTG